MVGMLRPLWAHVENRVDEFPGRLEEEDKECQPDVVFLQSSRLLVVLAAKTAFVFSCSIESETYSIPVYQNGSKNVQPF